MKNYSKKVLSVLLALVMLLGMLPATALAKGGGGGGGGSGNPQGGGYQEATGYFYYKYASTSSNAQLYYTTDGVTLKELRKGESIAVDVNTPVSFYVRIMPGYVSQSSFRHRNGSADYTESGWKDDGIYSSISSLNTSLNFGSGSVSLATCEATERAKDAGCTYQFHYSNKSEIYRYREFEITADPVGIHVQYDPNEGEYMGSTGIYTDPNNYKHSSVTDAAHEGYLTSIAIPDTVPTREGYAFNGWLFNGNTYWHDSPDISIDSIWASTGDSVTAETENGSVVAYTYTFVAQWVANPGSLTVTKTVEGGVSLPANFYIRVEGAAGRHETLDLSNYDETASSEGTYVWTLSDLAARAYTVTEYNYEIDGYTHSGETNKRVTVESDKDASVTLTNTYTAETYTVTWKNEGVDTPLEVDEGVKYGEAPVYNGATPSKDSTTEKTYIFAGWTDGSKTYGANNLPAVTTDVTYTAVYTASAATYTVIWKDEGEDGKVWETDENVAYGTTPGYGGVTPTKAADSRYIYTFSGWTPEISPVTGDATYIANYSAEERTYTVTWMGYAQNDVLETDRNVAYGAAPVYNGTKPTKPHDALYTYEFSGWAVEEGSYDEAAGVTEDVTFRAQFNAVPIPRTATVIVVLDGTFDADDNRAEGTGTVENIEKMIPASDGKIYLQLAGNAKAPYWQLSDTEANPGVYSYTGMENGVYDIFYKDAATGAMIQIGEQDLTISNADRTRYLSFKSLTYLDGVDNEEITVPSAQYYYIGSENVTLSGVIPVRSGYLFKNWSFKEKTYQPGGVLPGMITEPWTVTANWEVSADVYVNFHIDHMAVNESGANAAADKHDVAFTLDQREKNSSGDYTEILTKSITWDGTNSDTVAGYNAVHENNVTTYTATAATFANVPADMEYTVTTAKSGYALDGRTRADGKSDAVVVDTSTAGKIVIDVYLVYDPNDFDLGFSVKLDTDAAALIAHQKLTAADVPAYAHVKVTRWNGTDWATLDRHESTYVKMAVKTDGTATTETYPVWSHDTSNNAYYYRIEVVSYEMSNGTVISATDVDDAHTTYLSSGGRYTAAVTVTDGATPAASATLPGAYYESTAQQGTITAEISVTTHTVTLHPGGGKFSDETTEAKTISDLLRVPDLSSYEPTADDATFGGWYVDTNNNDTLDSGDAAYTGKTGDALTEDLHLIASWKADLTVTGTVTLKLPYACTDTAQSVIVALQVRKGSGTYEATVYETEVALGQTDANGYAVSMKPYVISGVKNEGSYRMNVILQNGYTITYQNEDVAADPDPTKYDTYTDKAYDAVFGSDDTAEVNILLTAKTFDVAYQIDAREIAVGFRPENVSIDARHDHGENSTTWEVFKDDIDVSINKDTGLSAVGTLTVAPYHSNQTLYGYVISALDYSIAGMGWENRPYYHNAATAPVKAPFSISYDGPANYEPNVSDRADGTMQDVLLTAKLHPNQYPVYYHMESGGLAKISETGVTHAGTDLYQQLYKWSYGLGSLPQPTREGYVFDGWYTDTNYTTRVTSVAANEWSEIHLYAKWEKDVIGPGGSDGIPDKYQIEVYYQTGEGGSVTPAYEVVTLSQEEGGKTVYLTSGDAVVSGSEAKPDTANQYVFDGWSYDSTKVTVEGFENAVKTTDFTIKDAKGGSSYTFTASFAEDKKGNTKTGGSDGIADKYQAFVEFCVYESDKDKGSVSGAVRQTFNFGTETRGTVKPTLTGVTKEAAKGYAFDIWTMDDGTEGVNPETERTDVPGGTTIQFFAHFAKDEKGGTDGGDGIPDKYQATVTYRVVNGAWSEKEGDFADKYVVFTLKERNETTGQWVTLSGDKTPVLGNTLPTGMVPAEGYTTISGKWNADIKAETPVTRDAVYTHTFSDLHDHTVKYSDAEKDENKDNKPDKSTTTVSHGKQIQVDPNGGIWVTTVVSGSQESYGQSVVFAVTKDIELEDPSRDGYVFMGWKYEYLGAVDITGCFTAQWEKDVIGGEEGGDGIPDKYQKKVTFRVENGAWADGSRQDIVTYVTLRNAEGLYDENGEGSFTVPSGMKANAGYGSGGWSGTAPTGKVSGTDDVTYLYQFSKNGSGGNSGGGSDDFDGYSVVLTKVDAGDKKTTLSGVVFDLYEADGDYVGEYTTGKDGKIGVKGLEDGGYYWLEIRPREGYQLDHTRHSFRVTDGKTTRLTVTNTRSDVPDVFSDEHYAYIIGFSSGEIRPNENITRGQVATIFFRLLDEETRAKYMTTVNSFPDVPEDMWCNTAVSTMAAMGIINGRNNGNFDPNGYITRAEFAAIASRFDPDGDPEGVSFRDTRGHWAEEEIMIAVNNGWILGFSDDTFRPNQNITRAQAMAMINRVLQRIPESPDDLLEGMVTWVDNLNEDAWYYLTIQEATNSHTYDRKGNGYERWVQLRENRDWAALER